MRVVLQPAWHLLIRLLHQLNERAGDAGVFVAEKGGGEASLAGAARAPDTVHVVVDVGGQVVVDDVADVRNVETASGDVCGHEDRSATGPEGAKR